MPRRQQHRDFTRSPKRKMSEAQMRSRQSVSPVLTCEHCGESDDIRSVETKHGVEQVCRLCRVAHHAKAALPELRIIFGQ